MEATNLPSAFFGSVRKMSTSSKAVGSDPDKNTGDRISVAEAPSHFPSLVIPRASPVPSVRSEIQHSEITETHTESDNGQKSPSTIVRALSPDTSKKEVVIPGRKGSEALSIDDDASPSYLAVASSPNASTQGLKSPRSSLNTSSIFTPSGLSPIPHENRFQSHRFSLLNEPSSLLSVASSTRSSMVSSGAEPDIEEEANDGMVMAAAQQARLNRPSLADHNGKSRTPSRVRHFHSLANARPKASRILGEDLHALATEQGGIPVRALVSPALSSPPRSAPSRLPQIAQDFLFLPTLGQPRDKEASPGGTPVQHPLRANPPPEKVEHLHRATTLPASTKRNHRPTFLPLPIDPSPGRRFERQSIVSTPYPYSGAILEGHRMSPRDRLRASIVQKNSHFDANAEAFTITLRDPRRLQTQIGLIPIHRDRRAPIPGAKKSDAEFFDDASLAMAITREYQRIRGWPRLIFNARGIISARVSCKGSTPSNETNVDEKPEAPLNSAELDLRLRNDSLTALSAAEEGRGSFVVAPTTTTKTEPTTAIARRKLEQSLTPLLLHPRRGTAKSACLSNLWSLVDAQRTKDNHNPSSLPASFNGETIAAEGAVAIELIESWKARNIGFAVMAVLVLSILATLLWTLVGVGGVPQEVDVHVDLPVHGHSKADTVMKMVDGWKAAGTRVQAGTSLGILVLLLGWSSMGAWAGGSWLVG